MMVIMRSVHGVIIAVLAKSRLNPPDSAEVGSLETNFSQSHNDMVQHACMPNFERAILFPHLVEECSC